MSGPIKAGSGVIPTQARQSPDHPTTDLAAPDGPAPALHSQAIREKAPQPQLRSPLQTSDPVLSARTTKLSINGLNDGLENMQSIIEWIQASASELYRE